MAHLNDPANIDIFALDELGRRGPKYGVALSESSVAVILSRLSEELETCKVSSLGYNNRLYFVTARSGGSFVIKVCGRYWKRVKTETEVVGLFLAGRTSSIPLPKLLAWDSNGREFGVEYTVMRKLEGIQLKEVWTDLSIQNKRLLLNQIAQVVVSYKSCTQGPSTLLPPSKIGNLTIRTGAGHGPKSIVKDQVLDFEFDIGATLEGLGPWTSYKAYLRAQLNAKMLSVQKTEGMDNMRLLLPRLEKLLKNLDTHDQIADSHQFVFTHGDLTLQNLLVCWIDQIPSITAVLDWEWAGMFPAEEEFFCSFDFFQVENGNDESCELKSYFYSILEDGGVETPRTLPHYEQRKDLYDLRENLFPWYIADCDDVADAVAEAVQAVQHLLKKLGS